MAGRCSAGGTWWWQTEEHPHVAIQAGDGGFVIVGEATRYAGSRIFVARTDERGQELFARSR